MIAESELIVADNVATYYYEGTDQEVWSFQRDFPNSAPPFGQYFIECRAPRRIISRVHGVQPWHKAAPQKWGVLCVGTDVAQRQNALATTEGRRQLQFEIEFELVRLWNTARSFLPFASLATLERDAAQVALSPERTLVIEHILQRRTLSQDMRAGNYRSVRDALAREAHRWTLDLVLFVNIPRQGREYIWGPLWHLRLYIKPDGSVVLTPEGDALLLEEPMGEYKQVLDNEYEAGHGDYVDLFDKAHSTFSPFLHTAMLTTSFLHCSNISYQPVTPPQKPLSNKQRRRGDIPRSHLTYHILDITPMRRVLRIEGREAQNGTQRALHICRGHFADYTEGRGLFGKYNGMYWIDQHVRGSASRGIALKDYRVTL